MSSLENPAVIATSLAQAATNTVLTTDTLIATAATDNAANTTIASGPPRGDDLTLIGMPNEILQFIIRSAVQENATLTCTITENGRVTSWDNAWVPELLLVCHIFANAARVVVADESRFIVECPGPLPLEHLDNDDRVLRLDAFPIWLQERVKYLTVFPFETKMMGRCPRMDLAPFPNLQNFSIGVGTLDAMLDGLVQAVSDTSRDGPADVATRWDQKVRILGQILKDSRGLSQTETGSISALIQQGVNQVGWNQDFTGRVFHAAVLLRLKQEANLIPVERLYALISANLLKITPSRITSVQAQTRLHVGFQTSKEDDSIIADIELFMAENEHCAYINEESVIRLVELFEDDS